MRFLSAKRFMSIVIMSPLFIGTCHAHADIKKATKTTQLQQKLAKLESCSEGRIGFFAIDTANNVQTGYRDSERFPMCCTSKIIGVATILKMSMEDKTLLSQKIKYTKDDLTDWSPITKNYLLSGMTVKELCAAAIRYSDNTAMNLLVKKMGGLKKINLFAHSLGNTSFRQDNNWPKEAYSGGKNNVKDSSTPKDMVLSLQKLVFTNILAKPQKQMLLSWLKTNTTGNFRIRAGLPKKWIVADKTGTGASYGTTNDIGIIWSPGRAPIIIAIYYTSNNKNAETREDIVANVMGSSLWILN